MAYKDQRKRFLHHSDPGVQYAPNEYQKLLKEYNMIGSISRKGNCYDKACIESFHGTIKQELVIKKLGMLQRNPFLNILSFSIAKVNSVNS